MSQSVNALPQDLGDRYVIERELGHGATATVYLARDLKFEEHLVAIKILSADFALSVPAERFLREIRTTAKLNHPHIVPLFDAGTTQGAPLRPFYVMRYIDGDVLSGIIARGPLSIPEALRIARQAASALGHAHRHGVIHRDIKPGNMILEDGHTWVTDFGIARAIASDDSATVTSTGVTIGTPAYMSPEQATGQSDLDGRSDIYSLGCVLYEMLAGKMPFDSPDVQAVMNKHLVEPLPSIREFRPEVPERVEQLLYIALAKKREDRFPTAAEFAEALSLEGAGALTPTRTQPVPGEQRKGIRWKSKTAVAAGVTLVVGVVVAAAMLKRPELKADRYLVTSDWQYGQGVNASMDAGRLLQDQLNQWKGITVMESSEPVGSRRPQSAAREVDAAWYVRGGVSRVGDSLRIRAQLYGTRGDSLVRERSVNVAASLSNTDSAFSRLADQLLFDDTVWIANGGRAGTRYVAARQAFSQGLAAVQQWELAAAAPAFRRATDVDPGWAQGHLWLALVNYWTSLPKTYAAGASTGTWSSSAIRAAPGRAQLSPYHQALADALDALERKDSQTACDILTAVTRREPFGFAGWYGLANCLRYDDAVIRDARSPSGWRFRTSEHQAIRAYQRAFQLLPAIHRAFRDGAFESVRVLLMTAGNNRRFGRAAGEAARFEAEPTWIGDTLTLIPYRTNDSLRLRTTRQSIDLALHRQREVFRDIATSWVTEYPRSSDALEALAIALELLGDRSALDSLRRARALADDDSDRLRIAGAEVWTRLKFAIPEDLAGIRAARALADSILTKSSIAPRGSGRLIASLAAVTGRGSLAAQISRTQESNADAPAEIRTSAPALLTFSALGGPLDSIRVLSREVEAAINHVVAPPRVLDARLDWLGRAGTLALPVYEFESLRDLRNNGDYLIDAEVAFLRGDTATMLQVFASKRRARTRFSAADLMMDALYPEAWLFASVGKPRVAIEWIDPTLMSLPAAAPQVFADPVRAGALVRAMALRAELASTVGDRDSARRWARAVTLLWSGGDEFAIDVVRKMERLALEP